MKFETHKSLQIFDSLSKLCLEIMLIQYIHQHFLPKKLVAITWGSELAIFGLLIRTHADDTEQAIIQLCFHQNKKK